MKWFIPMTIVQYTKRNEDRSFQSPGKVATDELALYNKNAMTFQRFTNCHKCLNAYAYIGEADSVDPYFSDYIREATAEEIGAI